VISIAGQCSTRRWGTVRQVVVRRTVRRPVRGDSCAARWAAISALNWGFMATSFVDVEVMS
jgi:hypothetical protein